MIRHILLVDDEANVLNALRRALHSLLQPDPPRIETHTEPIRALARMGEQAFDVVFSDYRMPAMDGVTFLRGARGLQPDCVRFVLSGTADRMALFRAINEAEIFRFLEKPWEDGPLAEAMRAGFERHDQLLEEHRLADESRFRHGTLTPQELELRRLEASDPGITKVHWGTDGSVLVDESDCP